MTAMLSSRRRCAGPWAILCGANICHPEQKAYGGVRSLSVRPGWSFDFHHSIIASSSIELCITFPSRDILWLHVWCQCRMRLSSYAAPHHAVRHEAFAYPPNHSRTHPARRPFSQRYERNQEMASVCWGVWYTCGIARQTPLQFAHTLGREGTRKRWDETGCSADRSMGVSPG